MTERSDLAQRVQDFAKARILCVGDVMLDRYVYGTVERISPEAPIPILAVVRETAMLGGAGNVVRNLAALKASCCFVSLIGEDPAGREVTHLIAAEPLVEPNLLPEPGRVTTIKVRYVAGSQQLLRADRETVRPAKPHTESELVRRAADDLKHCQAVVLSDYGKGVLSDDVIGQVIAAARAQGRPVVVDPRGSDPTRYAGATVITPNRRELGELAGLRIGTPEQIRDAARVVMAKGGIEAVLVTLSQDGMALFTARGEEHHLRAEAREVYDVSGAGDTVVALLACGLASGLALVDAARLASVAAGIVVGKTGTAVVYPEELVFALRAEDLRFGEAKAASMDQALEKVAGWRRQGFRVGFTNGCFDLLHPGHVSLLAQARSRCDKLIVASIPTPRSPASRGLSARFTPRRPAPPCSDRSPPSISSSSSARTRRSRSSGRLNPTCWSRAPTTRSRTWSAPTWSRAMAARSTWPSSPKATRPPTSSAGWRQAGTRSGFPARLSSSFSASPRPPPTPSARHPRSGG